MGSQGVYFVRDAQNKDNLDHAYCYSKSQSRGGGIVVEEPRGGSEVSVEALSVDREAHIIAVTKKRPLGYLSWGNRAYTACASFE